MEILVAHVWELGVGEFREGRSACLGAVLQVQHLCVTATEHE
jgi:hypothetical protein